MCNIYPYITDYWLIMFSHSVDENNTHTVRHPEPGRTIDVHGNVETSSHGARPNIVQHREGFLTRKRQSSKSLLDSTVLKGVVFSSFWTVLCEFLLRRIQCGGPAECHALHRELGPGPHHRRDVSKGAVLWSSHMLKEVLPSVARMGV